MKVKLHQQHMWDVVRHDDIDHHEDRGALKALLSMVLMEIAANLSGKRNAQDALIAMAAVCFGSDRARRSTRQKPGEDIDDFALHLSILIRSW